MTYPNVEVVMPPAYEPISLALAKKWLMIDASDTNHDDVITLLIAAMRRYAELRTLRVFVPRTLRLSYPQWCGNVITLPHPPLVAVDAITYLDSDGVRQTLDAAAYEVFADTQPGFVTPAYGTSWPAARSYPASIQITYRAGHAPGSPADEAGYQEVMPATLQTWMAARISTLFENREQVVIGTIVTELQHTFADGLLDELIIGERLF